MRARRLASCLLLIAAAAAPAAAKRVVIESPDQVVDVACQIRHVTTIVLPPAERILDFVVGDQGTWQLTGAANIAYVKPSVEGSATNVTLVTEAGRIYFFRVAESGSTDPDIHVHVELPAEPDEEALALGPPHEPMFISRDAVAEYAAAAAAATERARKASEEAEGRIQGAVDEFRSSYPTLMRFEYKLDRRAQGAPFHVVAMWHDGRFTYARSLAEETPALYEERDGQPSLVGYDLSPDGLFIVRRVLSDGWFQLGKRRAEWSRLVTRQPAVGPPPPAPEPLPDAEAVASAP
ncbi:MAG: hypothetical protein F4057_10620 [Acidobacteria bacterium]|nr:hypothetical protein [Acidobacteriota bacterium]MYI75735.1 hypothetical protein [Acidobacteriota bacterium]